jgi:hypothetical protein
MKYKTFVILVLSSFLFFASMTAQWKDISNRFPTNVKVYSMANSNNTIFAGTNDGVYKSTDGGFSWQGIDIRGFRSLIPENVSHLELSCLSIRGNKLFAGTNGIGVFIFDGKKWQLSSEGLPDELNVGDKPAVKSIAHDRENIFIATGNGRIYINPDGGSSWRESSIISSGVGPILIKGDSIFVGGRCNVRSIRRDCCLYLSNDGGNNWNNIDSALGCVAVFTLIEHNNNIYIGTIGKESAIFKSGDNCKSWIRLVSNSEYPFVNVQSIAVVGNKVLAGTIGGLLYSNDGGLHWSFIQHPTKKHKAFNLLSIVVTEKEIIALTPFELWSYPLSKLKN